MNSARLDDGEWLMNAHTPHMTRRSFLADTGLGFTGLALGALLFKDGVARATPEVHASGTPSGKPHFTPKAKSVIWIFCCGGTSHLESFDPKPELNKYAGKPYSETPYYKDLTNPDWLKNVNVVGDVGRAMVAPTEKVMGLVSGFKK